MQERLLKEGQMTNIAEKSYAFSNAIESDFPVNEPNNEGVLITRIINGSNLTNIKADGEFEVYTFNEDENKWFKI